MTVFNAQSDSKISSHRVRSFQKEQNQPIRTPEISPKDRYNSDSNRVSLIDFKHRDYRDDQKVRIHFLQSKGLNEVFQ